MAHVIGVDGGTESLRARVFDLDGQCVASASSAYETRFDSGARAEQDPEDWWRAIGIVPVPIVIALAALTYAC